MASRKKSTFASAQSALSKAMRNMETAIANLVGAEGKAKKKASIKKSKKSRRKTSRR